MIRVIELPVTKRYIRAAAAVAAAACVTMAWAFPARADGGLELHTSYPGMSVKPGDSLSIPISIDNQTGAGLDADVSISGVPENWEGYLQGGNYQVSRVYVPQGTDGADVTLHLTVSDELEEGTYEVSVQAASVQGEAADQLQLAFQVTTDEAGNGSFTSEYPQQEGTSGTSFSFSTTLINNRLEPQNYSLSSNAPAGWTVTFTPSGETTNVAGIDVESGASQGITVSVVPPQQIEAGDYQISCSAVSASETLTTDLTVTITGTYGLEMSTPDGRLSFDARAGKESDVTLQITNTGNVDLENVSLNSTAPSGWTVTYNQEDNIIKSLPAGSTSEVIAHVKPGNDAITGDYVTSFNVSTEQISDSAEFRVSVKTSTMWGIVAVVIIAGVALGLEYVFRKYGRR